MAQPGESIIEAQTRIRGDVRGKDSLVVRGRIRGAVELEAALVLESGGLIRGNVSATEVTVGGVLVGDVDARDRVVLLPTAQVKGRVRSRSLRVEAGARVDGSLEAGEVQQLSAAPQAPRPLSPAPEPPASPDSESGAAEPSSDAEPSGPEQPRRSRVVVVKKRS
jgi:cytoskeletal protein CcmA (bactofilin family)